MSHHDNELDKKELINGADDASDTPCPQRRRLLAILGVGVATAYIAPTLFSVGEAQAWDRRDRRNRHGQRGSYSRGSYDYNGRQRSRLRDYHDDPVLILEDVILGPPRR